MSNQEELVEKINNKIETIKKNANNNQIKIMNEMVNRKMNNNTFEGEVYVTPDNLFREIGILDPEGKDVNPFTGQPYENLYKNSIGTYAEAAENIWTKLPVYKVRKEVIQDLHNNQVLLVTSGTGSGKTVAIPKYLSHVFDYKKRIIVSNPKRIPTLSAAEFSAKLMDVPLGTYVGFKYRASTMPGSSDTKTIDRNGIKSRIVYATDGYILAKLTNDPLLSEYDAVVIDESHERNISIDLLLMLLKFTLHARPEFKLVIMSATVNSKVFSDYYDKEFKFKHVELPSESNFPVEEHFLDKALNKVNKEGIIESSHEKPLPYVKAAVERVIDIMQKDDSGAILVFIAGKAEATDGCMYLAQLSKQQNMKAFCIELSGRSSKEDEEVAKNETMFQNKPGGPYSFKVVFATEVAESSITIPLTHVIDTGTAKESRFYPLTGVDALEKRYISKASHTQRRGRAGRTKPGVCYNIFTKDEYKKYFVDFPLPPILIEDVTETILEFMHSKYVSHVEIPFKYKKKYPKINPDKAVPLDEFLHQLITPPEPEFVSYSVRQLFALGALKQVKKNILEISPLGEAMTKFRMLPPTMAKAMLTGYDYLADSPANRRDDILIIAALMEKTEGSVDKLFESAPRTSKLNKNEARKVMDKYRKARKKLSSKYGDMIVALNTYHTLMSISHPPNRESMNEEKKGELTAKARKYAKDNYIRYNMFKDAHKLVKEYRRDLNRLANKRKDHIYFEKHYNGNAKTFDEFIGQIRSREISLNREKLHSERAFISEDAYVYPRDAANAHINNILLALFSGFFVNYCNKAGKNQYMNCFQKERSRAQVDRFSFVAEMKVQPKHAFYYQFKDIGGRKRFNCVTSVPVGVLKNVNKKDLAFLQHCLKG